MAIQILTESKTAKEYPKAWKTLNKPFRHDGELEYWKEEDFVFCRPKLEEIPRLGTTIYFYNARIDCWVPWRK